MTDALALFGDLAAEVEQFGNHHRKHLKLLEENWQPLIERLSLAGLSDQVVTNGAFSDPLLELHRIGQLHPGDGAPPRQRLLDMATYFAYHFLAMNARSVRALTEARDSGQPDHLRFANLIGTVEREYRALVRGFLHHVLAFHATAGQQPVYAIAFVGAMSDHDDLDIAVIADGSPAGGFDRMLGRTQTTFLRHAQNIHPHLSNYISGARIWATIDEYKQILGQQLKNFVIVSQVIGAGFLVGDRHLFSRFRAGVYRRYFQEGDDSRYHEGFIRSVIAELRHLLATPASHSTLNPKAAVYRPVKMTLAALRTVLGVEGSNIVRGFGVLAEEDAAFAEHHNTLAHSYAMNEAMRFLYALHTVQEDKIHLDDSAHCEGLARVAGLMGMESATSLVDAFQSNRARAVDSMAVIVHRLAEHLRETSHFHRAFRAKAFDRGLQPASLFLEHIKGFRGKVFWDDIVDLLEAQPTLLKTVLGDLERRQPGERDELVREYVLLMTDEVASLFRLVLIIAEHREIDATPMLAEACLRATVECFRAFPYKLRSYVQFCYEEPQLLFSVIARSSPALISEMMHLLSHADATPAERGCLHRHKAFRALAYGHSKYLGRFIQKAIGAHPHYIEALGDFRRAGDTAEELLAESKASLDSAERRRLTGEYYDLEFVRTAVHALIGEKSQNIEKAYQGFTDRFVVHQFLAAMGAADGQPRAEDEAAGTRGFAFFATGGNARGEAFHDDYDYIAVVDGSAPQHHARFERVLRTVHGNILKRAMIPHNRLIEVFDSYVVSFEQLREVISSDKHDVFIDQSELLDSRLILGDPELNRRIETDLVGPFIHDRWQVYASKMFAELEARHGERQSEDGLALKEGRGGLRDINMMLLVLKAKTGLREPLARHSFTRLAERLNDPRSSELLEQLRANYRLLKQVRDLYRLSVAYSEIIQPERLPELFEATAVPRLGDDPGALANGLADAMQRSAAVIAEMRHIHEPRG